MSALNRGHICEVVHVRLCKVVVAHLAGLADACMIQTKWGNSMCNLISADKSIRKSSKNWKIPIIHGDYTYHFYYTCMNNTIEVRPETVKCILYKIISGLSVKRLILNESTIDGI